MFSSFTNMNIPRTSLYQRANTTAIEDKSNILTIVTWGTLGSSVLVFLVRQCIKFAMGRRVGADDLFILAATVFAIGLSVTLLILASHGLGVSGPLTLRKADEIQKALYASDFFYISTLGFAKLSLLSFFYGVYHQRGQRRAVLIIGIFILIWTVASLAAVAFQCGLPKPWEVLTLHCYNLGVFWIVYCIIDMTSDVAIVMLSINLVAYLKVKISTKIAVIACFAPRILVIGTSLIRLIYLYPISPHDNPSFTLWIPMLSTQIQACLSIITACIPYVRPFFETAESSIRRLSVSRSRRGTSDEESSYGCCSAGYFRGYKRAHDNSAETTQLTASIYGRTPDVSPRIPSPVPISPLTPPRFSTPPNTSASSSRSPSERGLRLQIPAQNQKNNTEANSPQTASSHALSPASHPLLTSIALAPVRSSILPAVEETNSELARVRPSDTVSSPNRLQPPRRFSLFPSQQQYSPLQQQMSRQLPKTPTPTTERSRSTFGTPVHNTPSNRMVETQTQSPSIELDKPTAPYMFPPRPSSSLERLINDDPLRSIPMESMPMAITTSAAIPAPIPAPLPTVHDARSSIPSYYVRTPPTAQGSTFSSPQSVPSYYIATPPTAQPSTFPQSNPYTYKAPPPPPAIPTSPQRQRNKRILTPQNSSRRDQMSPVSPMSPPTPSAFRREDTIDESPELQPVGSGWEDAQLMPVVQDTRSSPRIIVQRFS